MRKLTTPEKRILQYLDKHVGNKNDKNLTLRILKNSFGFDAEESVRIFSLWYYTKDGDYETFEYTDESFLHTFIKNLIPLDKVHIDSYVDTLYESGMKDKLFGDTFFISQNSTALPTITFQSGGIQLELDRETWEEHFSGLYEDDLYLFYQAYSSYSSNYYEVGDEEFDYVYTDDESIQLFETLSIISGESEWPGKDGVKIVEGDVGNFLFKILTSENYDTVVTNYISELSLELTRVKDASVRYCYEEDIKYDTNDTRCELGEYCIFIPYGELLDLIEEHELINLSELKEHEINGTIGLTDCYYDAWVDNEGVDASIKELNRSLERVIEGIVEDKGVDLETLIKEREYILTMVEKLGYTLYDPDMVGHPRYKSKDGKIEFFANDVDYNNKKIKFTYEGKPHIVPWSDFSNWNSGSVLDLNESVKVKKKLLREQIEDITKISIFDFDGTLMDTPQPEEGKVEWEEFMGEKYPHRGWWSKPESLDDSVFDIQPIDTTIVDYKKEKKDPNTLVIMLTGRLPHQSDQVEELLSFHNLYFDEYHYKNDGDTLNSKLNTIRTLLNRYPNVKSIEMWEDRESHVLGFERLGDKIGLPIKVNLVGKDRININESVDNKELLYKKVSKLLTSPPYIYTLESMGFDLYQAEKILSIVFGEIVYIGDNSTNSIISPTDGYEYEVVNREDKLLYYEDTKSDKTIWSIYKYDDRGNVIYFENSTGYWRKDVFDRNNERMYWINPNGVGGHEMEHPHGIDESINKKEIYYQKVSEIIKPPYFRSLKSMGIGVRDWSDVLSKVFNREVMISGESPSLTIIYTLNDGENETIYWERDDGIENEGEGIGGGDRVRWSDVS
jgi:hypothetical protein